MPGPLSAGVAASLLAAVGDVTFILSRDGTILDVAVSQGDLANHGFADWVGEAWIDTMTIESRPKVAEMLADATTAAPPRWRQVNHPAAGGDVPVRYLVMALGEQRPADRDRPRHARRPRRCSSACCRRSNRSSATISGCARPRRAIACCSTWRPSRC